MKVTVKFFVYLRELVKNEDKIVLDLKEGSNISQLLEFICNKYELREKLFNERNKLKEWVTIMKNGREIKFLDGMSTKLDHEDEISVFPPLVGG